MRFGLTLSTMAIVFAVLQSASAITWSVIDYPGSGYTSANGINSLGQIVGQYDVGAATHGFLLNAGTYSTIDFPGAISTYAEGINDNGEIVGIYKAVGGSLHGFLVQGGTFTSIDFPNARYTEAFGINNAGQIVGEYTTGFPVSGFEYDAGTYTDISIQGADITNLRGINNKGEIVGGFAKRQDGGVEHGVLISGANQRVIDAPNASFTFAHGMNDSRAIVGTEGLSAGGTSGFMLLNGNYLSLANTQNIYMQAFGINANRWIVGLFYDANNNVHGFLRTP